MKRSGHVQVNEIDQSAKKNIRVRTGVAIGLVALLIPGIVFGGWVLFGIVAVSLGIAIFEIMRSPGKKIHWTAWVVAYLFGFLLAFWPLIRTNAGAAYIAHQHGQPAPGFVLEESFVGPAIPFIVIGVALFLFFMIAVLDKDLTFRDIAYLFGITMLVGFAFQAGLFCRYAPEVFYAADATYSIGGKVGQELVDSSAFRYGLGGTLFVFCVLSSMLNDTFAFFGGMLFGKHKMNPRVSPKKTWEGFAFGVGGATAINLAVAFALAATGTPILPILDMNHWYLIVILSILLPFFGTLGDLVFSLAKRGENLKDFGKLIPGHGGILDRVDSHLFSFLGTMLLIALFTGGWLLW